MVDVSEEDRLSQRYPLVDDWKDLPRAWSLRDKAAFLSLSRKNLRANYKGPGKTQKDVAAVRADKPIPVTCGLYYYEVKITCRENEGFFSIGIGSKDASLEKLPGWEKQSYGFHTDDGNLFNCNEAKKNGPYAEKASTGDVIGCGVDLVERSAFFTLNGSSCGTAFHDIPTSETQFYPMIGMSCTGESAEVNFGEKEFIFNFNAVREKRMATMLESISQQKDDPHYNSSVLGMQRMIMSYLVTHGHVETAKKLQKSASQALRKDNFIENRRDIQQLLCAGKVSSAVAAIKQSYPTLLDSKPELHFRLLCLQFVEMVRRVDSGRADVSVTPYQPTSASRDTDSELNCTGVSNARGLVLPSPDWESSTTTTPVHAANGVHRISDGETEMSTSSAHLAGDDATVREAVSEPMDTDEEVCVDGDEPLEQTMTMAESLRRTSPQKPVSMQASESVIGSCSKSNTVATETHPTNGHTAMESGGQELSSASAQVPTGDGTNGDGKHGDGDVMTSMVAFGMELQQHFDKLMNNADTVPVATAMKKTLEETYSVLAYEDLDDWPNKHLFSQELRQALAIETNSAILEHNHLLPVSTLELMIAHSRYLVGEVAKKGLATVTHVTASDVCR